MISEDITDAGDDAPMNARLLDPRAFEIAIGLIKDACQANTKLSMTGGGVHYAKFARIIADRRQVAELCGAIQKASAAHAAATSRHRAAITDADGIMRAELKRLVDTVA